MKKRSRQLFSIAIFAIFAIGVLALDAASAQSHGAEFPPPHGTQSDTLSAPATEKPAAPMPGAGTMGAARAIPFDSIAPTATANGGERRAMVHGTLATGETVELHQSMQTPGTPAPPLHVIQHSELILVREGTLEFDHEVDGKVVTERAGPGGVFYVAFGTRHSIRNAGSTAARYFVVAIGGDAK
jgi:mannose-6-phosphate isomerase-like protein (cupin superfamily)